MARPNRAAAALEQTGGLDWALEQLESGQSLRQIAQTLGVPTMSLRDHLHDNPVHSARVLAAMEAGAEAHEQAALQILRETYGKLDGEGHPNSGGLASMAREIAQAHWRSASVRDPRRFSDKRTSDINVSITHDYASLPTDQLERLVAQQAQTLQLESDGTVTGPPGSASDSGEPG